MQAQKSNRIFAPLIGSIALTVLAVCATTKTAEGGGTAPSGPTEARQKISNISHFDVGTCFAKAPALPSQITKDVIIGLQVAARPLVGECLVDPKNRGAEQVTKVHVDTTWANNAFSHKVTGDNLTADGETCITDALNKYTGGAAPAAMAPEADDSANATANKKKPAKAPATPAPAAPAADASAAAVTNGFDYQHDRDQDPTVSMGGNEISDMVGAARLAMHTWCDCYESSKDQVPPSFVAKLDVTKGGGDGGGAITKAEIDNSMMGGDGGTPAVDPGPVGQCLLGKLRAFPFEPKSLENKFPFIFIHVNSEAQGDPNVSDLNVKLTQLELQRQKKLAAGAIANSALVSASGRYSDLVAKYKKDSMSVTRSQLITRCNAIVKADEALVAAQKELKSVVDNQVATVQALRKQDTTYPETVEKSTMAIADQTAKDMTGAETQMTNDKAACARLAK